MPTLKKLFCKVFGHNPNVEEVTYGRSAAIVEPTLENFQIRSKWTCLRCGYHKNNLPGPDESWYELRRAKK